MDRFGHKATKTVKKRVWWV